MARGCESKVHQTVQPVIFNLITRTDIPILRFSCSRRRFALSSVGRRPKRHTKTLGRDRFWVQSLSALRPSARPLLQPVVTCWLRTVTTQPRLIPFTGYPPTLDSKWRPPSSVPCTALSSQLVMWLLVWLFSKYNHSWSTLACCLRFHALLMLTQLRAPVHTER